MARVLGVGLLLWMTATAAAQAPCVSGPRVGQRPGPYSFLVNVGPQRGTSHCFICETRDRPAAIVFARKLDEPLAKLLRGLDRAVSDHAKAEFRAWGTFLHKDEAAFGPQVLAWSKKQALRNVPLGTYEDEEGPPAYRLAREAEVTVLLYVKERVQHNFAFRAGELTDARIAEVLRAVPTLLAAAKK